MGAHAMAVHGAARATGDIDVLIRAAHANALRVCRALRQFGAPLHAHGVGPEQLATVGTVYQLGIPPRRIDILTDIDGVSFDEVWNGRLQLDADGLPLSFIGLNELLINKRAAGRTKDLLDIALLDEARSASE